VEPRDWRTTAAGACQTEVQEARHAQGLEEIKGPKVSKEEPADAHAPFRQADVMTCDVHTSRLLLRIPEAEDAQPLLDIHEHPDVIKYVVSGPTRRGISGAWNSVATMIGHWHIRGYGQWTVVEKATGEVVGRVGLWNPEGWPGIELGWVIRRSRWGNGFATEAARASLDWTWQHSDVEHVISIISTDNLASVRVAQKIGETFERSEFINDSHVAVYGIRRPVAQVTGVLRRDHQFRHSR
jgi:RimJ/RimL family protein N-acetyltransferase